MILGFFSRVVSTRWLGEEEQGGGAFLGDGEEYSKGRGEGIREEGRERVKEGQGERKGEDRPERPRHRYFAPEGSMVKSPY